MRQSNFKLTSDVIGLDLGASRTGVARINLIARIAEPLSAIDMKTSDLLEYVTSVISEYDACCVVAGLPRGLDGQETEQTQWAENVIYELESKLDVPVFAIDEAVTTKNASQRAQPGQSIDSVAAGIIVEDFIREVELGRIDNVSI